MKYFFFTLEFKRASYGQNVVMNIYKLNTKTHELCNLGTHKYNTGSMKGHESECFEWLYCNKYISKKMYDDTDGCYFWRMRQDKVISIYQIN